MYICVYVSDEKREREKKNVCVYVVGKEKVCVCESIIDKIRKRERQFIYTQIRKRKRERERVIKLRDTCTHNCSV